MTSVLMDNATLNQCAYALERSKFDSIEPAYINCVSDAFIASLSQLIVNIVLYDEVYLIRHMKFASPWEQMYGGSLFKNIVKPLYINPTIAQQAKKVAIYKTAQYFTSMQNRIEFYNLMLKVSNFIKRKLPHYTTRWGEKFYRDEKIEHYTEYEDEDAERIDSEPSVSVSHILEFIFKKLGKSKDLLNDIVNEDMALSMIEWIYFRAFYYEAVCSILNTLRPSNILINSPAIARAQNVRSYMTFYQDEVLTLLEKIVRNAEESALSKLREEFPSIPVAVIDKPPIFRYVLQNTKQLSEIISSAIYLKEKDKSLRQLRDLLEKIRQSFISNSLDIPTVSALFNQTVDEVYERWNIRRKDGPSAKLILGISSGIPVVKGEFFKPICRKKPRDLYFKIKLKGTINVLTSFKLNLREINSLGKLYDKHFWKQQNQEKSKNVCKTSPSILKDMGKLYHFSKIETEQKSDLLGGMPDHKKWALEGKIKYLLPSLYASWKY